MFKAYLNMKYNSVTMTVDLVYKECVKKTPSIKFQVNGIKFNTEAYIMY